MSGPGSSRSASMVATLAARLAAHPPFDELGGDAVERLARVMDIRFVRDGEVVFREGEAARPEWYVVHKGQLEVVRGPADELVNHCDEGDVIGVRAHLLGRAYGASAKGGEDSIVYVLPLAELERLLAEEPAVARFLAAGFAADTRESGERELGRAEELHRSRGPSLGWDTRRVTPTLDVLTCAPDDSVRDAAQRMAGRNVGSIFVVDESRRPLGVLTDSDLRRSVVAAGRDSEATTVGEVMSAPVATVSGEESVPELVALMLRRGVHHFAVTRDGTCDSELVGVLSERDVLELEQDRPTAILDALRRATTVERLAELRDRVEEALKEQLDAELGMSYVAGVVTQLSDVLIERACEVAGERLGIAERLARADWCWLAMGSEGREEQLLRTDLDNALVFADELEHERAMFGEFAEAVIEVLVACGYQRCPGEVMASNPRWNTTVSAWKKQFSAWVDAPDTQALMHASIFFDLRPVVGRDALAGELIDHIVAAIGGNSRFLPLLASNAVRNPPPLSFFRNFVLERSGEHRDRFDVKLRAMLPLTDGARVLTYDLGLHPGVDGEGRSSSAVRWRRIAEAEPSLREVAREAATAHEFLMRLRAKSGLAHGDSGRYVPVDELGKIERHTLRSTFDVVADVQRVLRTRYSLDLLP